MKYLWKKIIAVTISAALTFSSGAAALAAEELVDWDVSEEVLAAEGTEELFASAEMIAVEETEEILAADEIVLSEETEMLPTSDESVLPETTAEEVPEVEAEAAAMAAEVQVLQIEQIEELELTSEAADVLYMDPVSGYCGDPNVNEGKDVRWSLDSEGTLTISGTGEMADWGNGTSPEWETSLQKDENGILPINKVVIGDGVTSIGSEAFFDYYAYRNLTEISIPDSVTSIGNAAFKYSGIKSLAIPARVTAIPYDMCHECKKLESVTMSGNVTTIGGQAFYACYRLSSIAFPETVTSIGANAFGYCHGLTSVSIPASVRSIGFHAFWSCEGMESVYFYGTAPTVQNNDKFLSNNEGSGAHFWGTVYVSNSDFSEYDQEPWKNWKIVYLNNVQTAEIILNEGNICNYNGGNPVEPSVKVQIENNILTLETDYTVTYENNKEIGTAKAIITGTGNYKGSVTKEFQIFPSGAGTCGENAAWVLDGNTLKILGVGKMNSFSGKEPWEAAASQIHTIEIAEGITYISDTAFSDCDNLQSVKFSGNAPDIGSRIFGDTSPQILVSGKTASGYDTFYWENYGYTNIVYLNQICQENIGKIQPVKYNGDERTPVVTVTILDQTLTRGTDYTVTYANNIEIGTAEVIVTGIGNYGGSATAKFRITDPEDNVVDQGTCDQITWTLETNGVLTISGTGDMPDYQFDTYKNMAPWGQYYQEEIKEVVITEGVTKIGKAAFLNLTALESVTLAETVTVIDNFAFYSCTALKTISFPNSLKQINKDAFSWSGITELILPEGLEEIGTDAFTACEDLKTISVPASVNKLDNWAFWQCENLEYIFFYGINPPNLGDSGFAWTKTTIVVCGKAAAEVSAYNSNSNALWGNYNVVYQNKIPDLIIEIADQSYTGNEINPQVVVKDYQNNVLKAGVDYTVSYQDNVEIGTATVTITAVDDGNYIGSATKKFNIVPRSFETYVTVSDLENRTYTGTAHIPTFTVTDGDKTLVEGTDYTVSYQDNVNAGTAAVTITAVERKGSIYQGSTTKPFTIAPKDISGSVSVTGIVDKTYTGSAQTQTIVVKDGDTTLAEGTDYTVAYEHNKKAGTATVVLTGKGNYTGNTEKTFKILPKAFASSVTVSGLNDKTYTGSAQTQTIVVKDGDTTLVEGTDYTVSYENNTNVGRAVVVLTGKGNYTGSVTKTFEILPVETEGDTSETESSGTGTGSGETEINGGTGTGSGETEINGGTGTGSSETEINGGTGTGSSETEISGGETEKDSSKPEISEPDRNEPDHVSDLKVSKSTTKAITLKWNKVTGADGYTIYRWNSGSKKWKKLATTKKLTYTDKKRSAGKKYRYAVSAYDKKGGKTYTSEKKIIKAAAAPASVKNLKVKKTTKTAVTLSWKKVTNATGYIVYRQNSGSKKWVKVGTTKKTSYTNRKLKKGKNYKYAVSAYVSYDGKTYSSTKKTVKAKTKK